MSDDEVYLDEEVYTDTRPKGGCKARRGRPPGTTRPPKGPRGQFAHWIFTIDIGQVDDPEDWKEWEFPATLDVKLNYIMAQLEIGESANVHYQGFLQLREKSGFTTIKKNILMCDWAHMEPMNGTDSQNYVYCSKTDEVLAGPFELGTRVTKGGQRTDWDRLKVDIKTHCDWLKITDDHFQIMVKHGNGVRAAARTLTLPPRPPDRSKGFEVEVHWGVTGCGKTYRAEHENPDFYKWNYEEVFQTYKGEKCLILDEFESNIKPQLFKCLCQGNPFTVPGKYEAAFPALWTKVVITTNIHPDDWYPSVKDVNLRRALFRRITRSIEYTEADVYRGAEGPEPTEGPQAPS